VTVSDGPALVALPHGLVGEDCATATAQLLRVGVSARCPSSSSLVSATVPAGRVIRVRYGQHVNPVHVPRGATVTLILSRGSGATTTTTTTPSTPTTTTSVASEAMPNVVGDTRAQAYAAMKAASLYFSTSGPNSGGSKWTSVTGSSPKAGATVQKFSHVVLFVK
jgi:beta-lactam-binding protein with PASTA domain